MKLAGLERVKYFAPVAICVYLAVLCVGLIVTSAFVENMRDVLAIRRRRRQGLVTLQKKGIDLRHHRAE